MEAATRPVFEPLAELPVEEPVGMSKAPARKMKYPDDELLSHGALLDGESPQPGLPEARPDSAIVPTLTAAPSGELLDPEILLGASTYGVPSREGTNGAKIARPAGTTDINSSAKGRTGAVDPASVRLGLAEMPIELMEDSHDRPRPTAVPAAPAARSTPSLEEASSISALPPLLGSTAFVSASPPPLPQKASPAPTPAPVSAAPVAIAPLPVSAAAPVAAQAPTPMPTPVSAPAAPSAAASTANPAMDRDFIARNQIVERYLSGRLPLKGATDFERFCRDNPQVLDELGLPERVNAGVRLLEASGKPEPWQDSRTRRFWNEPQWTIGLAAAVLVLGAVLGVVASSSSAKDQHIAKLQKQVNERPLDAAASTQSIRLVPSREAASNSPAVYIGGGAAQLADLRIDESRSAYKTFRITIDRIDQGRVAVLHNLIKDSNGHLRLALNSTALGPGSYQLTIEGLSWRGDPEPDSWVTIGIQR